MGYETTRKNLRFVARFRIFFQGAR
ncbi:MAG: hypothetical protein JWM88_1139, partial [Verrucomicrobia bacterium]|nr:hypothetical protein [Verrucomicrobiota bacterium]